MHFPVVPTTPMMALLEGEPLSLGIAFKGPEGIVLAADSRVTITAQLQQPTGPTLLLPATFDNATKLLQVRGQDHVGAVTYGNGAIISSSGEPRTAHSYIPEFEEQLAQAGVGRLKVREFAQRLSAFFVAKLTAHGPVPVPVPDMNFLVGGYDEGEAYGRVYEMFIPSRPDPVEQQGAPGAFGLVWGGQRDFADRLISGFDGRLPEFVQNRLQLSDQQRQELQVQLKAEFQAQVPFAFLPLQDCVDLAIFLIRTTITMQHWVVGIRGVGGAVDVAVITPMKGFTEVQQKRIRGEELW